MANILNPSHLPGHDRSECLENTRVQTLQDIHEWITSTGYPNILLLTGGAGTGKSTIATTVAETCRRNGYFGFHLFFLRGKCDPSTVLQTFAYNLAKYQLCIARSIDMYLRECGDLSLETLKSQFDILLRKPLSSISSEISHSILIAFDAIDECGVLLIRRVLMSVL